eukprot:7927846-Pyramimonas_sp.AAC.1
MINIPALPASDWSLVRIYPRVLRLIDRLGGRRGGGLLLRERQRWRGVGGDGGGGDVHAHAAVPEQAQVGRGGGGAPRRPQARPVRRSAPPFRPPSDPLQTP